MLHWFSASEDIFINSIAFLQKSMKNEENINYIVTIQVHAVVEPKK
jgi:Flp pilus assembly protein protease CpaA